MRPGQCRACCEIDIALNGREGCRARQVSRTAASISPFGLLIIVALDFDAGTTEVTSDGEGCHSRMNTGYGVWYKVYGIWCTCIEGESETAFMGKQRRDGQGKERLCLRRTTEDTSGSVERKERGITLAR